QSRYDLLKKNKLSFIRKKPTCNEGVIKKTLLKKNRSPRTISLELARTKARSVGFKKNNILVVGSDTVISIGGAIIR
ncbi:Maf family protein, partial [Alphaproteobacteria bacterium]|nr:Maf family protein [Alphaproteobacteria bacterium]